MLFFAVQKTKALLSVHKFDGHILIICDKERKRTLNVNMADVGKL